MAAQDLKGVNEVIDRYLESYVRRDVEALATTLAQDNDTLGIGTDQGEYWRGWTTIRNVTEKQYGAILESNWRRGTPHIRFSRDGNVAWFAEEMTGEFLSGDKKTSCPFRFTAVLEKRANNWVIVQFHRSVPVEEHAVPYLETHGVTFD
jgi:ketosteroid isomerase-like protein